MTAETHRIEVRDPAGRTVRQATGWYAAVDRVVTAWHAVDLTTEDGFGAWLELAGTWHPVQVLDHDDEHDLAWMAAPPSDRVHELGPLPKANASWSAPAFPHHAGRDLRTPSGTVSNPRGARPAQVLELWVRQGTMVDWAGISGAPVLAESGRVVGVLTKQDDGLTSTAWAASVERVAQWLGLALPAPAEPSRSGDMNFYAPVTISGGQVGTGTQVQHLIQASEAARDLAHAEDALRTLVKKQAESVPWLGDLLGIPRHLSEVWVEVTVHEASGSHRGQPTRNLRTLREAIAQDGGHGRRWALVGGPGQGKSVLLRRLALDLLAEPHPWLPILVHADDLRPWDGRPPTPEEVVQRVTNLPEAGPAVRQALADGRAVFLVDGLDEARAYGGQRGPLAAREALGRWEGGVGACPVVVASRPVDFANLPGFGRLDVQPLAAEARALLLEHLCDRAAADRASALLAAMPEWQGNPLMVTLAAHAARSAPEASRLRRHDLYEEAVRCLLDPTGAYAADPARREPFPTLGRTPLEGLAFDALAGGRLDRDTACRLLQRRQGAASPGLTWPDLLDAAERSHLLTRRGPSLYADLSFPHRTLAEYLAARALLPELARLPEQGPDLAALLRNAAASPATWAEVLSLAIGMLPPPRADLLMQAVQAQGSAPLACRVVASAEGLSEETVLSVLGMTGGREGWKERGPLVLSLVERVGDLRVAASAAARFARQATHGADLWHADELLRRIAEGEVSGPVEDGTPEDAQKDARRARAHLYSRRGDPDRLRALLDGRWRPIPAGSFHMGSTEATDHDRFDGEGPQHRVEVRQGYALLQVPVTNAMYECFDAEHRGDREFEDECGDVSQHPVVNVSWYEAAAFARWVGQVLGRPCRLPTETEWEHACRAGSETRFWSGPYDADLLAVDWVSENSGRHTHAVDDLPSPRATEHPYGLLHLHGNVVEWCADERQTDYSHIQDGRVVDPGVPQSAGDPSARRVFRGGSWLDHPLYARSAFRFDFLPADRGSLLGFRLLLPPWPPSPSR